MPIEVSSLGNKADFGNVERFIGADRRRTRYRNTDGTYASDNDYENKDFWSH